MKGLEQLFNIDKLRLAIELFNDNNKDVKALWILHYYYRNGFCGVKIDHNKAIACLKIPADAGHAGACCELIEHFLQINDEASLDLAKKYVFENNIDRCIAQGCIFDELHYYSQKDHISRLVTLKHEIQEQLQQPKKIINNSSLKCRFKY